MSQDKMNYGIPSKTLLFSDSFWSSLNPSGKRGEKSTLKKIRSITNTFRRREKGTIRC